MAAFSLQRRARRFLWIAVGAAEMGAIMPGSPTNRHQRLVVDVRTAIIELMGNGNIRDDVARDTASKALNAVLAHERECAQAREQARIYRENIQRDVAEANNGIADIKKTLFRFVWGAFVAVCSVLGAILWQKFFEGGGHPL